VSVYSPFKAAYNRNITNWLRSNPRKTLTIYEIAQLVAQAQMQALTPQNVIAGFEKTGIFPFNDQVFSDLDFAPAEVTNRLLERRPETDEPDEQEEREPRRDIRVQTVTDKMSALDDVNDKTNPGSTANKPGPSTAPDDLFCISPAELLPLPKAAPRKMLGKGRRRGSTRILTDTPVRNSILERNEKKDRAPKRTKNVLFPKSNKPRKTGKTKECSSEQLV
jgi:hypothetical protein